MDSKLKRLAQFWWIAAILLSVWIVPERWFDGHPWRSIAYVIVGAVVLAVIHRLVFRRSVRPS